MAYVRDVMKKGIMAAKLNDSVQHISKLLTGKNISNLPVINEKHELVGVVSEQDIIRALESDDFMEKTARDIMTKNVLSVKENDSLEYVAKVFTDKPYRRLPVTRGRKVVGVITRDEIISSFMSDYY